MDGPRKIHPVLIGFILTVILIAGWALLVGWAGKLRSSPTAMRNPAEYEKVMHPSPMTALTNGSALIPVTITNEGEKVTITHPNVFRKNAPLMSFLPLHVPPSQALVFDSGAVQLKWIRVASGRPVTNVTDHYEYLLAHFFHADLKPCDPAEVEKLRAIERPYVYGTGFYRADSLVVGFDIETQNLAPSLVMSAGVFDARTRKQLNDGWGCTSGPTVTISPLVCPCITRDRSRW